MFSLLPLGLVGLLAHDLVGGLRLPTVARPRAPRGPPRPIANRWNRRASIFGESALNDTDDVAYYTDITLNGASFSVLIDTGSSDLWVVGDVPNAVNTGYESSVQYAVGSVEGPVLTADLDFAGFTVKDQAFMQVQPSAKSPKTSGLIGLGPSSGSTIYAATGGQEGGLSPLDRIFISNTSTPNYITVLLNRLTEPGDIPTGEITVSEVVSGYENITNQPKLPITSLQFADPGNQHWMTLLDANGVSVGGQGIPGLTTTVPTTEDSSRLTAVFDSGFSVPQVTKAVANGIYSNIQGASLQNLTDLGEIWVIPCSAEIDLSFSFGGITIPVHPLDTNLDLNETSSSTGQEICVGGFQPISTESGGEFDLILGMGFLRNAYMLVDLGDFIAGSRSTQDGYVQLLPLTTDANKAHQEFQSVRSGSSGSSTGGGSSPTKGNGALGSYARSQSAVALVAVAVGFFLSHAL